MLKSPAVSPTKTLGASLAVGIILLALLVIGQGLVGLINLFKSLSITPFIGVELVRLLAEGARLISSAEAERSTPSSL